MDEANLWPERTNEAGVGDGRRYRNAVYRRVGPPLLKARAHINTGTLSSWLHSLRLP